MKTFIEGTDWKFIEKLNSESNKIDNEYYFDSDKAIKIKLESIIAEQLAGWTLVHKDIRNIKSWSNIFLELLNEIYDGNIPKSSQMRPVGKTRENNIMKSLLIAIVTLYGKLFTKAEGRKVKLEKSFFKKGYNKFELHNDLINLRNKFAAHGGGHEYEYVNVFVLLDPQKERNTPPIITRELSQPDFFDHNDIPLFIEMLDELLIFVDNKIKKISDNMMEGIISKGPDFWYNFADWET